MSVSNRIKGRYGIVERKKAELDQLTNDVLDAQYVFQQKGAIVQSLEIKSQEFTVFLSEAEAQKETALSNRTLLDDVVQSAKDLKSNVEIASSETVLANQKMHVVADDMKLVIDQLIVSAEIINKLEDLIVRKKAVNPLILDDLVKASTKASTDANKAVALALTALQSTYAAMAIGDESESTTSLELLQSEELVKRLTVSHTKVNQPKTGIAQYRGECLKDLIDKAYVDSEAKYKKALIANNETTRQLREAKANLDKAQINLTSLEKGLAAATAAALAA